jgi:hypothetical protein
VFRSTVVVFMNEAQAVPRATRRPDVAPRRRDLNPEASLLRPAWLGAGAALALASASSLRRLRHIGGEPDFIS